MRAIMEAFMEKRHTPLIFCDSQSCIALVNNEGRCRKAKHFATRVHFVRDVSVVQKEVQICYISTTENVADVFTKSLGKAKHQTHRERLLAKRGFQGSPVKS